MASRIEASKTLKDFSGEGDIVAWLSKVEIVAKLSDVKDVAQLIPLYLEGDALALYLELDPSIKSNFSLLSKELLKAYSDSEFVSFNKLKALKWTGEPVEVYANNLRKLAKGAGLEKEGLEQAVKLAFVTGFPDSISLELQQIEGVEKMTVTNILGRARILAASGGKNSFNNIAAAVAKKRIECYTCKGPHLARDCPDKRKEELKCYRCEGKHVWKNCPYDAYGNMKPSSSSSNKETCSVVGSGDAGVSQDTVKSRLTGVPVINVHVNGQSVQALVDTGCTKSMVRVGLCDAMERRTVLVAFDGSEVKCSGVSKVEVAIGAEAVRQEVLVMEQMVGDIDMVIGMDLMTKLGGVKISQGQVQFGNVCAAAWGEQRKPDIEDKDFEAFFDGNSWEVRYFWTEGGPPVLKNTVSTYNRAMDPAKQQEFEAEVDRWIEDGILLPWDGEVKGVIPLMAVEQPTKQKIRPVLDFREVNKSVSCHTGDDFMDVCSEKLREWRRLNGDGEMVDLKAAYLQIRVSEELWQYQLVKYKGRVYCLTRLGFGLSSAPRIMTKILKTVLGQEAEVKRGTSSFIDDIMVNTSVVPADKVILHLKDRGLEAKAPEALEGGAALGLKLSRSADGELIYERANAIPEVDEELTRKALFSICGKLVGHYPVASWLRVVCSYLKRHAEGERWDDFVGTTVRDRLKMVVDEVRKADPVRGRWQVPRSTSGVVWCDASDLALGVVLDIEGVEVEDASWMRKKDDFAHINVAELEAVLKGINLCEKWDLEKVEIITDSATVYSWLSLTLTGEKKVKTKGAAEVLVKRRLGIFKSLVEELGLQVVVRLVKSEANKADGLTRIRKKWLIDDRSLVCSGLDHEQLKGLHDRHHTGVERSWYLAKHVDETVKKDDVKEVVKKCERCQSIDPAPVSHTPGKLGVEKTWSRLAIDVTHYGGRPYLSMIDCGPGRFVLWRELRGESAVEICKELDNVFYERGPVDEVLMDNAMAFHSQEMAALMEKWGTTTFYRAAYRASGNGIVERCHRTIKSMAERSGNGPIEAVFWYNVSPRYGQRDDSVPQKSVSAYDWRIPCVKAAISKDSLDVIPSRVQIGDEVWIRPGSARCFTQWDRGFVTGINSVNNVEVNGVPRHILDLRRVIRDEPELEQQLDAAEEQPPEAIEEDIPARRYPRRDRVAPVWMRDFVAE